IPVRRSFGIAAESDYGASKRPRVRDSSIRRCGVLEPSAPARRGMRAAGLLLATRIHTAVVLQSGMLVTGFIVRESGTEVEVRDHTGATTVIKKDDLEARRPGEMPSQSGRKHTRKPKLLRQSVGAVP